MDYFLFLAIWVIFLTAFWFKDWPKGWPIQESEQILQGLGYAKSPDISARMLPWKDKEGHDGMFQPYVLELPITLWGRDLLKIVSYLGARIAPMAVWPQKIQLRVDSLHTLNDFQKLLGDINWIRPYLKIPNVKLKPLFQILEGDSELSSKRELTPEARKALTLVEEELIKAQLQRCREGLPIILIILPTEMQPTGLLWQEGPLLWIHSKISAGRTLDHYPTTVASLALLGIQHCLQFFGIKPSSIVIPYDGYQQKVLTANIDEWAILACINEGPFDNHYPKHPLMTFFKEHPVIFPQVVRKTPIKDAVNVFTDGSKTGCGVYMVEGKDPVVRQYYPCTPQMVELQIVIEVIKDCDFPFNLISDSQYVVNLVLSLEVAGQIKARSTIQALALQLQKLLWERRQPLYIGHVRAHSGLPGPLSRGNDIVDNCTRMEFIFLASPMELASQFHSKFHVNAKTLQRKFGISRAQARDVVTTCGRCLEFQHPPSYGVNPRGLLPLQVWQMDVTHFSEFGKLKYVHVSIDTCSGIVYASPMAGEKASHVIQHCLEAWAAWGKPQQLKTDNGPAYTAKTLVSFCQQMEVQVKHGLPYNPQGQGIIERAHRTLKELLIKQKGGIGYGHTPKIRLSLALFTLNFLQLDKEGRSAAERHANTSPSKLGYAKWKDVLTGSWNGPDPVLAWARGCVCMFPQNRAEPVSIPEWLV